MEFYGLCSKVLVTFKTTYGSKMELYGPNIKVVMAFKTTHGMSNGIIWIRQQGCSDL